MELVKITSNWTDSDVNELSQKLTNIEVEIIENIYSRIRFTQYNNSKGFIDMLAIIDNYDIEKLTKIWNEHGVKYQFENLTNSALMGYQIDIDFEDDDMNFVSEDINNLIQSYIEDYTTQDTVLDKILERGVDSLTHFDKEFLV